MKIYTMLSIFPPKQYSCSLITLTFFTFVKLLTSPNHFLMKVSPSYYAIPKQLYHTSYSPLENSRSSSLQTSPSFTHSLQSPSTINRPSQISNPVFIVRDLPRHNLASSQAVHQQLKIKPQTHQYYTNNPSNDDVMAQIQQRLQQLSKKVNKNTEDIKSIKQKQKNSPPFNTIQAKFAEQIYKMQQRQALFNQECLFKIVKVKEEMFQISAKIGDYATDCNEKYGGKFDQKILIKVRNLIEDRVKQETAKIRLIIENETNKLAHELRWELNKETSSVPLKSKLKYPFKAVKMTYNQYIEAVKPTQDKKGRLSTRQSSESPRSGRCTFTSERVYHIDKEGYLLDQDNYYLLDEKENMIRLDASMLAELKREGLLRQ